MTNPWTLSRRSLSLALGGAFAAGCSASAQSDRELIAMPGVKFPLKRAPDKRCLEDAAGKPFFLNGDTAWAMAAALTREDADFYLRDRAARGFNAVLVKLVEKENARTAPANVYGQTPFTPMPDFTRPNDAYFAHVDWIVARAETLGILMVLSPAWLGAKGQFGGWYQEMRAAGPAAVRSYGRYLGARYRDATNIMWLVAGDFDPPDKDVVIGLAEGIREGGSTALMTAHCHPYSSPLDVWGDQSWLDVSNLYSYQSLWVSAMKEYVRPQRMPYFMLESYYENEHPEGFAEDRIRRQAYDAVLTGAFGHVLGNSPIWHFNGPGVLGRPLVDNWRPLLDSAGARSMKVMRDLFTSIAWWRLAPDVDARLLDAPGEGENRPTCAVDDERRLAICYLPTPASVAIRITFFPDSRRVAAEWRDPSDGRTFPAQAGARTGDVVAFAPPPKNASGKGDWVLVLRAQT